MIFNFICWLQLRLYLLGFRRLAHLLTYLEPWVEPPAAKEQSEEEVLSEESDPTQAGPGWSLVEVRSGRLEAIDYDPMFNRDPSVDMREVALPTTHLDIN